MQKKCAFCSFPLDTLEEEPYRYVEGMNHETQAWMLHPYVFCSAACTRRYVRKFNFLDPNIVLFTEMYLRQIRGVTHSLVAPDTSTLACYTIDGVGQLSLDQFRDTEFSQRFVENTNHLHIDKRVFIGKKQKICEIKNPSQEVDLVDHLSSEGRYLREEINYDEPTEETPSKRQKIKQEDQVKKEEEEEEEDEDEDDDIRDELQDVKKETIKQEVQDSTDDDLEQDS
jgi:hypothetical protein